MAAQGANDIAKELGFSNQSIYCWKDSEIVLYWPRKDPQNLTAFEANGILKIQPYHFPWWRRKSPPMKTPLIWPAGFTMWKD